AEIAAGEVAIPDRAVQRGRETPRPRSLRERVLGNDERLRIDAAELVRPELAEPRRAGRGHHDAVWLRVWRRHIAHVDPSSSRVEASNEVRPLRGEPEDALPIEHGRMRIGAARMLHRVFADAARPGVELADVAFRDG